MLVYEYKWDATKQQTKTGLSESCSHWGDTDPTNAAAFGFGPGFRVSFWLKICHRVPAIYVTPLFNTATNSQLPLACMSLFRGPNSVTRVLLNTELGHGFQKGRKKQTKKGETRSGHPRAASTCRQTDFQLKNATIWGLSGSGDVCAYIRSVTLSTLKFYYHWNLFLSNLGVTLNLELTCTVSQSDNWCGQWI